MDKRTAEFLEKYSDTGDVASGSALLPVDLLKVWIFIALHLIIETL